MPMASQAGDQRQLVLLVPPPAILQTFLENDAQRFAQRIDHGNRRRVVIGALLAPEIHGGGQIEIPALHRSLAVAQDFFHARADGDGRHARGALMAFCVPAEAEVDSLAINVQGHADQRGHRINDQQRAQLVGHLAKAVELREHARRRLAMAYADELDLAPFAPGERPPDPRCAPGRLHAMNLRRRCASAISAMRSEKTPFTQTMASSPGSSGLTTAASMRAGTGRRDREGHAILGLKRARKSVCTSPIISVNQGSICPTSGVESAR